MMDPILVKMLEEDHFSADELERILKGMPFRITPFVRMRFEEGNYSIQAMGQFLPNSQELDQVPGFVVDPNDEASKKPKGDWLIQSYANRALLLITMHCLVYCRFCFRPGVGGPVKAIPLDNLIDAIRYISEHQEIEDVVISGGDPLAAPRSMLFLVIAMLCAIPHVKKIRIDTRAVAFAPESFDETLLAFLALYVPRVDVYAHINHPDDISHPQVLDCIQRLRRAGVTVYNQSVVLGGVNDDPKVQVELSNLLYHNGVIDYARYLPDPVAGTAHFDVSDEQILAIAAALGGLSGPAQPQLVFVSEQDRKERCLPGDPEMMALFLKRRRASIEKMVAKKS